MRKTILSILAALPLLAFSQEALTLDKCLSMAKENNKSLRASEYKQEAFQYGRKSSKALFFPSVSLTGIVMYSNTTGSYSSGSGMLPVLGSDGKPSGQVAYFPGLNLDYELGWIFNGGVKLEQPIYMGGKIQAGYKMSKLGYELAIQNRRLTESEVIVETSKAYANVVKAKEMVAVAKAYGALLDELMRAVEIAKNRGMKSSNDVLKVKVKANECELNLRKAENACRLAKMNLCHYIGKPLTKDLDVTSTLPMAGKAEGTVSDIVNRPEFIMVEHKSELAKQKVNIARSDYLPQVGLVGQFGYSRGFDLSGQNLLDGWGFLVGVQVSIPLIDAGNKINKIKYAKAEYAQYEAEREDVNEKLRLDIARSFNNLDEAYLEHKLAKSSVDAAEENLRASKLQYERGTETISDHLEAQAIWQQAKTTLIEAETNCFLRWIEFQKATGALN